MTTKQGYTARHARAGLRARLPRLDCFANHNTNDTLITVTVPEYTAICPKTGLPDFGTVTIRYSPDKKILELKSLKMYVLAFRNLGIFYENAVNKILTDVVRAARPRWCVVRGEFSSRGGIHSAVEAAYNGTGSKAPPR